MYFDPVYFIFILPAMLLAGWAQLKVKWAYAQASKIPVHSGVSGAEAARRLLATAGLSNVGIEKTEGHLSDHYDPKDKVLRLSPEVYSGRSLASVGIAAHEAGHALQDAARYAPLVARNIIVPVASFGSNASWIIMTLGFVMQSFQLIAFGVLLFSLVVIFQVVNLPVEFNASSRAKELLFRHGIIAAEERAMVSKVLGAAAMTYVAATVSAILTLAYYLFRMGLLGNRDQE